MLPDACGAKLHWGPWGDPRLPLPDPLHSPKPAASQGKPGMRSSGANGFNSALLCRRETGTPQESKDFWGCFGLGSAGLQSSVFLFLKLHVSA